MTSPVHVTPAEAGAATISTARWPQEPVAALAAAGATRGRGGIG